MKKGIIPERKWKIAFWMSCLVLVAVSYLVLPAWWEMIERWETRPEWVWYFHAFPLSLFLSLIIWLYFRAYRGPVRYTKGWLTAFFVTCVPGGALYGFTVNGGLRTVPPEIMPALVLLILEAAALFLLCLQVLFAIFAFGKRTDESSKSMRDQV